MTDKKSNVASPKVICLGKEPTLMNLSSLNTDPTIRTWPTDPCEWLAIARHTFGEYGGVNKSIECSTTFTVLNALDMSDIFTGKKGVDIRSSLVTPDAPDSNSINGFFLYGRHFNPTVLALGREISALEGTEAGYPTSSGLSAIVCSILNISNTGDIIIAANTLYGGTFAMLKEFLGEKMGIKTIFADDINDIEAIDKLIIKLKAENKDKLKLIYAESLSNPTLTYTNISGLSSVAHNHNLKVIIDNTFTPLTICPASLGADVVVHSLTKFINGTSDIIAGVICSTAEFVSKLMDLHLGPLMILGPLMDPKIAFEISLRLQTLPLRIKEHSRRALYFARKLRELDLHVTYPGLEDHPQHNLMTGQMNKSFGYGGLFTVDFGTKETAFKVMNFLQNKLGFGWNAVSLGYFDTLMSCSASSPSSELSANDLKKANITQGLVRFSIGITGSLEQRYFQMIEGLIHCKIIFPLGSKTNILDRIE